MIEHLKPEDCCGCTACASICPTDAITMVPDSMGFPYPVVDSSRCIQCGACDEVCAFNELYDKSQNLSRPDVWGVRHKDMKEVMTSRSGAAFIAISDWILRRGGIVYGVGFGDHFRVVHKRAVNRKERDEFKGSKYVQSDLSGIFRMVKKDLQSGLVVLFSGTPCQTAGLKAFIGKELRPNLYLTDILCYGVPSPYIWKDYLSYLEKQFGDEIVSVDFRDKVNYGWKAHMESFEFKRRAVAKRTFTRLFSKHIILRKSCGNCQYTNLQRPGDVTLGDFWHYEKIDPELNADDRGLSLVIVNTEKGRNMLESIRSDFSIYVPVDISKVLQPSLQRPFPAHNDRDKFEKCYESKGFEYVLGWLWKETAIDKVKVLLSKIQRLIKWTKR